MSQAKIAFENAYRFLFPISPPIAQDHNWNLLGAGREIQEALLVKGLEQCHRLGVCDPIIVLVDNQKKMADIEGILKVNLRFDLPVYHLPHTEYWGSHRFANQVSQENDRMLSLYQSLDRGGLKVIISSLPGMLQHTLSAAELRDNQKELKRSQSYDLDELMVNLVNLGYQQTDLVSEPGYYAVRGGLLDIFPSSSQDPFRLEFFGDDLKSIRTFDPNQQTSLDNYERVEIGLAQECLYRKDASKLRAQTVYEYFLANQTADRSETKGFVDALLKGYKVAGQGLFLPFFRKTQSTFLDNLSSPFFYSFTSIRDMSDKYQTFFQRLEEEYAHDLMSNRASVPPSLHFPSDIKGFNDIGPRIEFGDIFSEGVPVKKNLEVIQEKTTKGVVDFLGKNPDVKLVVLTHSDAHSQRADRLFQEYGINCYRTSEFAFESTEVFRRGQVGILQGSIAKEIYIPESDTLFIPEHCLFGDTRKKVSAKRATPIKSLMESFKNLSAGSLVVHIDHGIGKFLGMKAMKVGGIDTEFMEIEYANRDKVYVPIDKLGLVQKYATGQDQNPRLDRLKSQGWERRKNSAKKAVRQLAINLLEIHAKRKMAYRKPYSEPGELYFQFENDFLYDETPDQERCIEEVQADLSLSYPMDRLICGDVGFGKTEIALRAAMRVAIDGYQVMLLAPTTILSFQHYQTFFDRFDRYGVKVDFLNRFVSPKKAKETVKEFSEGKIDILIGTHRILSKDIQPKNLALVIIDEEQRFGVGHKESLKGLRSRLDVLSLSATPIPRSLHMAILGLKEISILMTPPRARLPIKTYIAPWDEALVGKAIQQEVSRGGQVFFIHNRVENILEVLNLLKELLPDVDIRIAHGQMPEKELEKVILAFLEQKFSVLLCTTIIESGVDMPNVNTILINKADRFGMAQLYQMRGRVGRSSRQSFAYFLTSGSVGRNIDAQQRLEVLAAHQELGAGFQVASHDLELRGAGDLLGADQSGKVNDVGIDLYMDMLEQEILRLQGDLPEEKVVDPEINLQLKKGAYIPKTFITEESQRLSFYKRLFSLSDQESLEQIAAELEDRYGRLPPEVSSLVDIATIKLLLKAVKAISIGELEESTFELKFGALSPQMIQHMMQLPQIDPEIFSLRADYSMIIRMEDVAAASGYDILKDLAKLLLKIKGPDQC